MKTSSAGIDLIKEFESFASDVYRCAAGKPTIGYGHVLRPGETIKTPITRAKGEEILRADLERFERAVTQLVQVPVTQGQFDALVSFAFNVGEDIDADTKAEGLGDSTLLKKLNAGDAQGAADEFPKWNKCGGKVLAGLTRRRNAERALFLGTEA
jgi:lysozyme